MEHSKSNPSPAPEVMGTPREFSELLDSYDSAVWLAGRKMATEGDGARLKELRSKILAYFAETRATEQVNTTKEKK